ncbi:glutarate dioxygenase GlaH [Candidatus Pseudothioglobus sp. Uisw_041]|uniref:glutarate dioxygenase GlaH n=1 Tax=Candidatus Pseudothioglobus sp. Uisw_041 TaxID=3230996 RepID=UPI003A8BFD53
MNSKNTLNVGFELSQHKNNSRVQVLKLSKNTVEKFSKKIVDHNVQSIEYKPFLRFYLADCLNKLTDDTLGKFLLKTLKNRSTGAILLECELLNNSTINGIEFIDFNVLLSTAISHLIGIPNLDSMSGKFYARFSVKNEDNSDSYLRQAHRRMELHNDGTYVEETTDWVIMQKILEVDVEGGDSLLLHVDDWKDLDKFYHHSLAKENLQWGSPSSKNITYKTSHPIFLEEMSDGKPIMSFIDQFVEPLNIEQGLYLYEMGESLEKETNTSNIKLPEGSMLIINNYCWLHGRDKFIAKKNLHRELLRQRGVFAENTGDNDK